MNEIANYNEEEIIETTSTRVDGKPTLDSFFNKDGLLLRVYGWLVKNAIGIILLIHGLNSHARLTFLRHNVEIISKDKAILKDENNYYVYENSLVEHFNKNGYSVYSLDLQGHGQSDGWENLSLNINKFDDLVYDVVQYIRKINENLLRLSDDTSSVTTCEDNLGCKKLLPIYIIGQSMGGNIALRTLEILGKTRDNDNKINIKGCISLSSMISFHKIASPGSYKHKFLYLPSVRIVSGAFPTSRPIIEIPFRMYPYLNDVANFDKLRFKQGITLKY
ncbi:lysophospholipase, putative [Plasmodium ovale wallikeri]|uniref:Lysophospholipase, putative n=1 Tax=Plasmodium ovale wallikeri TaxID=864142 RepID=A0A1A8YJ69_PLAOA|nr:lysophospholipase, putative [Plasmodium ovale wallikeri]SBT59365.1 lysophospholipase, putative [Plasmodium ovale wallikeri]